MKHDGKAAAEFRPGANIAIKVPASEYAQTVVFYRDILALHQISSTEASTVFEFGAQRLWIDRADQLSQAEIWLEITCHDVAAAREQLTARGIRCCDTIEPLPGGVEGFWILNPGNIVHLVRRA